MRKTVSILIALVLCFSAVTIIGCKAGQTNAGSSKSTNTSAEDYPIHEAIVGKWTKSGSTVDSYTFNADGTGSDSTLGSFTYKLEYRKAETSASITISGWVLHISYNSLPAAKIMWISLASDTKSFKTLDTSGNSYTYNRK